MRDTATVVFEGRSMTRVYQEIRMNALIEKVVEYSVPNPLLAPLEKLS